MKNKSRITLSIILLLVIASGLFYWYQLRPAQIKHKCSWVAMHSDAVRAQPAVSISDLKAKGIVKVCPPMTPIPTPIPQPGVIPPLFNNLFNGSCEWNNREIIREKTHPAVKAQPAKDWYEPASKEQYNFCLHDNGL